MSNSSVPTVKGNKIGPWKLGETLGLGSTGKVQLAYDESTNQQAAIKVISKAIFNVKGSVKDSSVAASTPDSLPYGIEREIIIMKLLNHPNVLRLYDVWETNSNLYMVLEYAQKGELFNLLVERGPLPEKEAIRFFRQIVIGISYCHALGIVHRDLKPENLLLDHKFNIKIADFGMAALETEDKLLETSCGSPHYAAPEIVSGIPYHGFASDVWSCGVILFALLTGRLPFDDEDGNIRNLLLQVQSGRYEMPGDDEISPDAQDLIARILTVDPEQRIKARDILKHPLLQKYPSINDSKSIRNLPREDTYLHPLSEGESAEIDENILQNLVVLWHGREQLEIINKLREPGANAEKTLYALLDRFKSDTENDSVKHPQSKKRVSQINPVRQPTTKKAPSKPQTNASPKRRNRTSMISVSSSHKRPVSFNKLSNVVSPGSVPSSNSNTPSKRVSVNLSSNKRLSAVYTNSGSPTPASRHKRVSIVDLERERENDTPPVPIEMLKDYSSTAKQKRLSRNNMRLSFKPSNKRGSITTKLISTYAKLSEDDDWEYIEKETKRTSSDFATLCDQIFEHEKFEQIRREKEELERKVRETKEREERERREKEIEEKRKIQEKQDLERRQLEIQRQMDEEVANLGKELQGGMNADQDADEGDEHGAVNGRSVSEPLQKKSADPMADLQANIDDLLRQRTFSLQTRPVSRLDPGVFSSDSSEKDQYTGSEDRAKLNNDKIILETIRRSKFLGSSFDINKELKRAADNEAKKQRQSKATSDRIISTTNDEYETQILPKNATASAPLKDHNHQAEPRKISDIKVPQFTRKSRQFGDSNKRLSVLSMYSSKQSYTNLADLLNEEASNAKGNRDSPNDQSGHEPEFLFENVQEDGEVTGDSSHDGRLYEVPEDSNMTKEKLKLNFADRFKTSNGEDRTAEDKNVRLPTLPPLDGKEAKGLGIYQSSSESLPEPAQHNVKSMIQNDENQPSETAEVLSIKEDNAQVERQQEAPLNASIPKHRTDGAQKSERMPSKEGSEKKRNTSFFRKFSKSSNEKTNGEFDAELYASVAAKQLFNGLQNLLQGWKKYGLKGVKSMPDKLTLTGKLSSENILSLRSTLFEMVVWSRGKGSIVGFRKKSGSTKTLKRLVSEIEKVLLKERVLTKESS